MVLIMICLEIRKRIVSMNQIQKVELIIGDISYNTILFNQIYQILNNKQGDETFWY